MSEKKVVASKFHVSELNVRHGQPFGESEEDQALIANLRGEKLVQPFKARKEGNGYGVYVGRRRFLAKTALGVKEFVVGTDVIIEDVDENEARVQSWIENLTNFHKTMNPIVRAKALNAILSRSTLSLRSVARKMGIPASNISEWLKILELTPRMQKLVLEGKLEYTLAMRIARLKLGTEKQDELAGLLVKDPLMFMGEIERASGGKLKRGIKKGMFFIDRISWDKRNPKHQTYYKVLTAVAEKKGVTVPELIQNYIIEHLDDLAK